MRKTLVAPIHYAPVGGSRSYVVTRDKQTGLPKIEVDPAKRFIYPFVLTSEPEEIPVPAAIEMCPGTFAEGLVREAVIFPIDNKGPFEIVYSEFHAFFTSGPNAGQPMDQFTAVIFDPDGRPVLMNREIPATAFAGGFGDPLGAGFGSALSSAAGRPFVWPETFFMDPYNGGKALFMAFRNLTTEDIIVRWVFHGIRYYHPEPYEEAIKKKEVMYGPGRVSMPYWYTTDKNVILQPFGEPGDTFDFQVRITDEADVEVFKLTAKADAPFLSRIQEKAGKRHLDNSGQGVGGIGNGVHSSLMWGTGEFPFIPFETIYWEQNTKIMLTLTNALSDERNNIFPVLSCRKIGHVSR